MSSRLVKKQLSTIAQERTGAVQAQSKGVTKDKSKPRTQVKRRSRKTQPKVVDPEQRFKNNLEYFKATTHPQGATAELMSKLLGVKHTPAEESDEDLDLYL